jgi:hypothetical protein
VKVGGDVFLDEGFAADGAVRLPGADISGMLTCSSARLAGADRDGNALVADGIEVGGTLFLRGSVFAEALSLRTANIRADLVIDDATLHGSRVALVADLITVAGDVSLYRLMASETVSLRESVIRGDLILTGATIQSDEYAFDARGVKIGGYLIVDHAQLNGNVTLDRSQVGADLTLRQTSLTDRHGRGALLATAVAVGGSIILDTASIVGTVNLSSAKCAELTVRDARLESTKERPLLIAVGIWVTGNIIIQDTRVGNTIDLTTAHIGGQLIASNIGNDTSRKKVRAPLKLDRAEIGEMIVPRRSATGAATVRALSPQRLRRDGDKIWRDRLIVAGLLIGITAVTATLITILAIQIERGVTPSDWLFALAGIAMINMTVVYLSAIASRTQTTRLSYVPVTEANKAIIKAPQASANPLTALWPTSRLQQRTVASLEAVLESSSVVNRISESVASRLVTGNLRNYTGILSVALNVSGESADPGPNGEFSVQAAAPLEMILALGAEVVPHAYSESVSISGGIDAEIIDFRIIVTVEDLDGRPIFGSSETVSLTAGGSSREFSLETNAPTLPGTYPLIAEVLQENRLVHVLRAQLQAMPGGGE